MSLQSPLEVIVELTNRQGRGHRQEVANQLRKEER